jgi:LPS sulfotransferase NodH
MSEHYPILYQALLFAKDKNWDAAHDIAQSNEGHADFDRIHALLHRIEGDEWNARYWYRKIGLEFPLISIEDELDALLLHYKSK